MGSAHDAASPDKTAIHNFDGQAMRRARQACIGESGESPLSHQFVSAFALRISPSSGRLMRFLKLGDLVVPAHHGGSGHTSPHRSRAHASNIHESR